MEADPESSPVCAFESPFAVIYSWFDPKALGKKSLAICINNERSNYAPI